MEWKNPRKELPKNGTEVAVLVSSWSNNWPLSKRIFFGIVGSYICKDSGRKVVYVENNDDEVGDAAIWYFNEQGLPPEAWTCASNFKQPEWMSEKK